MLFSILLGGCLLLLSSIILENKFNNEVELTIQEKKNKFLSGKVKKTPWTVIISQNIKPVLNNSLKYDVPELLYISQSLWNKNVPKIKLNIAIGEMDDSISNGEKNNCNISLKVADRDYLLEEDKKELNFIILHEIAHCYIGKEKLKSNVTWDALNKEDKEKASLLYKEQEDNFFQNYCKECEIKSSVASPAIVFHELLADAYATNWILSLDISKIDLEGLYKKRALSFIRNPLVSSHPSHFVIQNVVKEFEKNGFISDEEINKITQKALFEYLQEIPFHYDKVSEPKKKEDGEVL